MHLNFQQFNFSHLPLVCFLKLFFGVKQLCCFSFYDDLLQVLCAFSLRRDKKNTSAVYFFVKTRLLIHKLQTHKIKKLLKR